MSLTIGVRYLLGRVMATSPSSWDHSEWPPHPDRLFQALVASHFEGEPTDEERQALEWLEQQEPPQVIYSGAHLRTVVTHYVPVNDVQTPRLTESPTSKNIKEGVELLPEHRPRKARVFPTAVPESDCVYFTWMESPEEMLKVALAELCRNVSRLGHSSSLATVWVAEHVDETGRHTLVPSDKKWEFKLRAPSRGRLHLLEQSYSARLRPTLATYQGYATLERETPTVSGSCFEPALIVLESRRERNRVPLRLGLPDTLRVTQALRNTLMKRSSQPVPELLSGHRLDGNPSQEPHVSVVPLAYVGHRYADGHLLGLGLVLPKTDDHTFVSSLLADPLKLTLGPLGVWELQAKVTDWSVESLRSRTWSGPPYGSRVWSTVTPVVLERYLKTKLPKSRATPEYRTAWKRREREMKENIARSCEYIGLPKPRKINILQHSLFRGAPSNRAFPTLKRKRRPSFHVHACLQFDEPVRGPIVLGAGRYQGYRFFRPLFTHPEEENE